MKRSKILFWTTTAIIGGMMIFSGYSYLTSDEMKEGFRYMGFTDTFRIELGIAKILGSLALLLPFTPHWGKLFAYFGFTLTFISATIVHLVAGDPLTNTLMPVAFMALLAVSFYQYRKLGYPGTLQHA